MLSRYIFFWLSASALSVAFVSFAIYWAFFIRRKLAIRFAAMKPALNIKFGKAFNIVKEDNQLNRIRLIANISLIIAVAFFLLAWFTLE